MHRPAGSQQRPLWEKGSIADFDDYQHYGSIGLLNFSPVDGNIVLLPADVELEAHQSSYQLVSSLFKGTVPTLDTFLALAIVLADVFRND